jgi:phosphoribosylformylglycinamidine synthase
VRTNTLSGPGADAAVVRVKDAGVSLAMALDGNGRYCSLDAREGAKLAVAEACRNISVSGAQPLGATNCLNYGNPEKPEIMAQLVAGIEGLGEACSHFGAPITGGNVSLYNETLGKGIDPTPVIGVVGLRPGMEPPQGVDFQSPDCTLVLLGGLLPGADDELERRFGSSQYAKVVLKQTWGLPPALDLDFEKRVQDAVRQIAREGLAESLHDLSDGGLAVAAVESSFGPKRLGARLELETGLAAVYVLFHEAPSRVLLSVDAARLGSIREIADSHQVPAPVIGRTIADHRLRVRVNGTDLISAAVSDLYREWDTALERMLEP